MQVLDDGHRYLLEVYDGGADMSKHILVFVKREGPGYPFNMDSRPGTNCQEVLRAVIDRTAYLDHQQRSNYTKLARFFAKLSLWMFEIRAAKRHRRKRPGFNASIFGETCKSCGHVGCNASCARGRRLTGIFDDL